MRAARPANLFQPSVETYPDRYPEIFRFARAQIGDGPHVRLLSFGCSTGEEAFALRRYFPQAEIRGLDINPLSIATAVRRRRASGDRRLSFAVAGSVAGEPLASYDAVFCMAVLRHAALSNADVRTSEPHLSFAAVQRTASELLDRVRDGGLLIIQHSHVRFRDTAAFARCEVLMTVDNGADPGQAPFGPDGRRLDVPPYGEVVFRRRR